MATNVEIIKQLVEANTESFYVLVQGLSAPKSVWQQ